MEWLRDGVEAWNTRWKALHAEGGGAADLSGADLRGTDLSGADLRAADLREADLGNANLQQARFVDTELQGANLTACRVYGISAWDLRLDEHTKQAGLVVTPYGQPEVSV